ncbi:MAG: hypothetical protein JNM70_16880 [Anaerolineae bacterium]|nr:hypothetical protein [Anaerolineae bacterium]
MSDYTISIPDRLLERARQFAEQHAQSLDEVILARLEDAFDEPLIDLPAAEQAELKAMAYLSDDALFSMMREQMPRPKQERMAILMDGNTQGTITEAEYQELAALVEQGQRLTLRKATAMNILLDRGFKVRLEDMKSTDE